MYSNKLTQPYEGGYEATPLTTGDVARGLRMSPEGVRYLVRDEQLRCTRTPKGWRLFQPGDVWRLADQRTKARATGKLPSRRTLGPRTGPRQMVLPGTQLRLVGGHGRTRASLEKSQVSGSNSPRNRPVSDNGSIANRTARRR